MDLTDLGSLPTARAVDLAEVDGAAAWLVRSIWSEQAVGFIAGAPKCCKSWLGLDLAISVASGTPCLDRFEVDQPGPALVFLAEDSLPQVRRRIAGVCRHRRVDLASLDLHVVTASSLRLDAPDDQRRLAATLAELRPRLLVLDPLVRLHQIDENSAAEVSALLSLLRHMQREYAVAIAVVHHMSKRARAQLGQALRGSTDLHAWSDSAAYLVRHRGELRLTLEHRAAASPEPFAVELVTDDDGGAHLQLATDVDSTAEHVPPEPLVELVRKLLADAQAPLSRSAIRRQLRVNNQRLGDALLLLQARGLAQRGKAGWVVRLDPPAQLTL